MEHKLIFGGEQFLPFARSRIKALRATGLTYGSQQFEVDGVSIKVRIAGEHEYIRLEGEALPNVCVIPGKAYATTVALDAQGIEVAPANVGGNVLLRKGTQTTSYDGPYVTAPTPWASKAWGLSPFSTKHLEGIVSFELVAGTPKNLTAYLDDVPAYVRPGEYNYTSNGVLGSTYLGKEVVMPSGNNAHDSAIILSVESDINQTNTNVLENTPPGWPYNGSGVASGISTSSTRTNFRIIRAKHKMVGGVKATKANGAFEYELDTATTLSVVDNLVDTTTRSYGDFAYYAPAEVNVARSFSGTSTFGGERVVPAQTAYAVDKKGNIVIAMSLTSMVGGETESSSYMTGAYSRVRNVTDNWFIRIGAVSASGTVTDELCRISSSINSTYTQTASTFTSVRTGSSMKLRNIIVGIKTVCLTYSLTNINTNVITDFADIFDYGLSPTGAKALLKRKTIALGVRGAWNTGARKLRGASMIVGDYIWCTQYCLNITTEAFCEIPGYINGFNLPSNVETDTQNPDINADYVGISKSGDAATYYWLNLKQSTINSINANIALGYPLSGGLAKKFKVVNDVVTEVALDAGTTITGTSKASSNDVAGETLIFPKKV